MIKTISPVDGSTYVERETATSSQISDVLERATRAQQTWKNTPLEDRKRLCSLAVDAFVADQERICTELTWQMGRPIRYGMGEVNGFVERATHMISIADQALEQVAVDQKEGFTRYIKR